MSNQRQTLNCPLTNLQSEFEFPVENPMLIRYNNKAIGKIEIPTTSMTTLQSGGFEVEKYVIAGLSRQHWENYHSLFKINHDVLMNRYKEYEYPKHFEEKANFFLKFLFEHGGKEYKTFDIIPEFDYTLAFGKDSDELKRILLKLEDEGYIRFMNFNDNEAGEILRTDVMLTKDGISALKELIPNIPMVGLVDQEIRTGDDATDQKIIHSKRLFFKPDSTTDDKRSACESLCFVLEPLRDELSAFLTKKDTEGFFDIVNNYEIRHNKANIKKFEHEEQLEWVYYTLLNSVTLYWKLKKKLSNQSTV